MERVEVASRVLEERKSDVKMEKVTRRVNKWWVGAKGGGGTRGGPEGRWWRERAQGSKEGRLGVGVGVGVGGVWVRCVGVWESSRVCVWVRV
jgi:hypothetical protein